MQQRSSEILRNVLEKAARRSLKPAFDHLESLDHNNLHCSVEQLHTRNIVEKAAESSRAQSLNIGLSALSDSSKHSDANHNARPHVAAALSRLSDRYNYSNIKDTFFRWLHRTKVNHSLRIATDKLFKTLRSNQLCIKAAGFRLVCNWSESFKKTVLCITLWHILTKRLMLHRRHAFQFLERPAYSANQHTSQRKLHFKASDELNDLHSTRQVDSRLHRKDSRTGFQPYNAYQSSMNPRGPSSSHQSLLIEAKIENLCETIEGLRRQPQLEALYLIMQYAYTRFLGQYERVFDNTYYH